MKSTHQFLPTVAMRAPLLSALILQLGLAAVAQAANVLISVDKTGANLPVTNEAPRVWNFKLLSSLDVSRGLFGLNDGQGTTESISFKIFSGLGGNLAGNTQLASVSLGAGQVDGFFATLEQFSFTTLTLTPGDYSVTLTTAALPGNDSYFLKSGRVTLYTDNGSATPVIDSSTQLDSSLWVQDASNDGTAVPEASTTALAAAALCAAALRRRR